MAAPQSDSPASAPLRLDLETIRAANRASKSDAQNLAENSGTYFGDDPKSKSEKIAESVSRTGKPDCLAPNPAGSLLSVIDIAIRAAIKKCN